jgi:hypothetical protein
MNKTETVPFEEQYKTAMTWEKEDLMEANKTRPVKILANQENYHKPLMNRISDNRN